MTGAPASVRAALDVFEPGFPASGGNWEDVVRCAGVAAPRPRLTRRRVIVVALVTGVAAALVATPALGLRGLLSDLFGREDVPFTGTIAPTEIKREFSDLGVGAPAGMAPHAIAQRARRIATIRVGSKRHVLWVAPTRGGGFCWLLSGAFGGCQARRAPGGRGVLGVAYGETVSRIGQGFPANVGGTVRTAKAWSLAVDFADGTRQPVPFYYVSRPIDAGFFFAAIRSGHRTPKTRPLDVVLRDRNGHVLARQRFFYETAAERARQAKLEQGRGGSARSPIPPARLPRPTPPLQRGRGSGVTVVAGRNGVVVFDTTQATAEARRLIAGTVEYGCFARLPYHPVPEAIETTATTAPRVAVRVSGASPPFLGCDVEAGYGHRWPNRLHEHSAVEIPFGLAGERFFADRAAARDLGLFVRSADMHTIRKLRGAALDRALRARYGPAVLRLRSPSESPPAGRIGYAPSGRGTVFVEWSTTGRRFFVDVVSGRIADQNIRPLGFVF